MGAHRKGGVSLPRIIEGDDVSELGMDDLIERLRFSPREGRIWLGDQRMILLHLTALSALRRQLVDTLGFNAARSILTHMGYTGGASDAALARRVRSEGSHYRSLMVGPQLHAIEGMTCVHPIKIDMDVAKGRFYGELIWNDSAEVDAHMAVYGLSADPVCWTQLGYATGFTTAFMGRQVVFREVECRAMGAARCKIVGKTVEEWGEDLGDEVKLFQGPISSPKADRGRREGGGGRAAAEFGELVGVSSGFIGVCHMLEKVADTNATVLLLGETGVGKGMFARTLHRMSCRREKNFMAVNCAAIPENLVEAELFGVERGAFTGAVASRPGRFERADGGTLFLDEVGTLNLQAQGKLLRALQEREIERVGDIRIRRVDVRVIAATNENLDQAVADRRFREDLMFRLNVFPIRIPPLRERRDDIPVLMDHFLKKFSSLHKRDITGFTERAVDALLQYDFPGNIRELENMIERGVILAEPGSALDINHLFTHAPTFLGQLLRMDRDGFMKGRAALSTLLEPLAQRVFEEGIHIEDIEAEVVRMAVERSNGNFAQAGRLLGMTRAQIAYRMKEK